MCEQNDLGQFGHPNEGEVTSPLLAEVRWMACNSPHLNFSIAIQMAKIDADVRNLLKRCQTKSAEVRS